MIDLRSWLSALRLEPAFNQSTDRFGSRRQVRLLAAPIVQLLE
jgi:hypothetical protein